jgi:signal recognition particle receptor subunit beta
MLTNAIFIPLIENKIAIIGGFETLETISIQACSEYPFSKFYISAKFNI